jgi:hypothetical protein
MRSVELEGKLSLQAAEKNAAAPRVVILPLHL